MDSCSFTITVNETEGPLIGPVIDSVAHFQSDDIAADDHFGLICIVEDTLALISAEDDDNGTDAGAVYVFNWNGTSWIQTQKLKASDGAANDDFGNSIALQGEWMVITAWGDDGKGAAYVFNWNGSSWVEHQKLLSSDLVAGDQFGANSYISGNRMVIGANTAPAGAGNGAAYVFELDGSTWVETHKLTASDGAVDSYFGNLVRIDGDRIAIGALLDDENGTDAGALYVFDYDGSSWNETEKVVSSDIEAGDNFGNTCDLDGDRLMVGAYLEDPGGTTDAGSIYYYEWTGSAWDQIQKINNSVSTPLDEFGDDLDVEGNLMVAGTWRNDSMGTDAGSAFLLVLMEPPGLSWMLYMPAMEAHLISLVSTTRLMAEGSLLRLPMMIFLPRMVDLSMPMRSGQMTPVGS